MRRLRDPKWFLIFAFLAVIGAVPLAQLIKETGSDEGILALEVFSDAPTAVNLRAYEKKLESTSWAGQLSRPWVQRALFRWLNYGGEKVVVGKDGWYFFRPGLNYMIARPEPTAHATNDPVAAIIDFRDQLAARGIELLIMPVPNKDTIYPDHLISRPKSYRPAITVRTREVVDQLRAAKIEVIDLFKEFSEERASGKGSPGYLYLAQDTHWSPVGVDIAAKAVAHRLNELGWIQPGNVEYAERRASIDRTGDILRMLQTPGIEKIVRPETVHAAQVMRADNSQRYKDDPNSEILVIGDSFMRIYQEDEPNAAGFIAHLAKELKQPILSLVNDGGGSTIVREELAGRPFFLQNKKVVIWEFVERDIGIGIKGWQKVPLPDVPAKVATPADKRP